MAKEVLQQMNVLNMESYLSYMREKLKNILNDKDFIGRLEVEINVKEGGIVNMNIATRESVKI